MKWIAILFIVIILITLFSALLSLIRAKASTEVAKALTVRIGLSLLLFVVLMLSFYAGVWTPHSL